MAEEVFRLDALPQLLIELALERVYVRPNDELCELVSLAVELVLDEVLETGF